MRRSSHATTWRPSWSSNCIPTLAEEVAARRLLIGEAPALRQIEHEHFARLAASHDRDLALAFRRRPVAVDERLTVDARAAPQHLHPYAPARSRRRALPEAAASSAAT